MNSARPIEDKAGAPGTGVPIIAKTTRAVVRSRSTESRAQRERIVRMLRAGPQSTVQLRAAGIFQVSTRILELRRRNYNIVTTLSDLYDADGFLHRRVAIYTLIGEPEAGQGDGAVTTAGAREALLRSVGAKARDGSKRTNKDKRNAVLATLSDPEWSKLSDREIARQCAVSNTFVSNIRTPKLPPAPQPPAPPPGGGVNVDTPPPPTPPSRTVSTHEAAAVGDAK